MATFAAFEDVADSTISASDFAEDRVMCLVACESWEDSVALRFLGGIPSDDVGAGSLDCCVCVCNINAGYDLRSSKYGAAWTGMEKSRLCLSEVALTACKIVSALLLKMTKE